MTNETARKKLSLIMLMPMFSRSDFREALFMGVKALDELKACEGCSRYENGNHYGVCDTCARKYEDRYEAQDNRRRK